MGFVIHQAIEQHDFSRGQRKSRECPGAERLSIVIQKTRELRMQQTEIRLLRRCAVRSFESSALQPDLRIL